MEKQENILGTERIGKLLKKFALPCIISMLVNSLYNIVDQIFIGWGVGYLGNGATNIVKNLSRFLSIILVPSIAGIEQPKPIISGIKLFPWRPMAFISLSMTNAPLDR